jgi:hypothetical protein
VVGCPCGVGRSARSNLHAPAVAGPGAPRPHAPARAPPAPQGLESLAQLAGAGPYAFGSPAAPARPYRWAQDLAGVDVLPPLPPGGGGEAGGEAGGGGGAAAAGADPLLGPLAAAAAAERRQRVQVLVERLQRACGA